MVTQQDLDAFQTYAANRLSHGGVEHISELFREWLELLNRDDVNAAIREGVADVDDGRTQPFDEFMAEVRAKLSSVEQ